VSPRRDLSRVYPQLTVAERFKLLIAAQARADAAEIERLLRSCPIRTYRLRDPALNDLYERAWRLTAGIIADLLATKARLDALEGSGKVARLLLILAEDDAAFEAFQATGSEQPTVAAAVRGQRKRFRAAQRRARGLIEREGAALVHAFAAVCRTELNLEPHELVAAAAASHLGLYERFLAIAPDESEVEEIRVALSAAWSDSHDSPSEPRSGKTT
jgi:hypothetical protein